LSVREVGQVLTRPGVIIVAPPWPRSGSGNLFAAQAAAHARRCARVFLLLTPLGRGFARHKTALWEDVLSAMKYPDVETVSYPRTGRRRVLGYLEWLRAGRDDLLAISARYGASGRTPGDLGSFVAATRVEMIHANHVFSVPLAQRVADIVQDAWGQRPRIVLDTHDVQSDAFAVRQKRNPFSRRLDTHNDLLRTELALCAQADTLVHVTQADRDFFANHLPQKSHTVVLPTLDPGTEAELMRLRREPAPAGAGLVYLGNRHEANLVTLRWLLTEVLPLVAPEVAQRVRIAGAIGGLLGRRDPDLFRRHASLFVGEVPSLLDLYAGATAVLAPAAAGTGTSIKLIEALCAGKPVLTTGLGLRGLPAGEMTGGDIHVCDDAAEFAAAMSRLSNAGAPAAAASPANAGLYDRLFSNARYFAALDDLIDGGGPTSQGRKGKLASRRAVESTALIEKERCDCPGLTVNAAARQDR
jgi:glycosyltransferase involved in cell wall biosynthesis